MVKVRTADGTSAEVIHWWRKLQRASQYHIKNGLSARNKMKDN